MTLLRLLDLGDAQRSIKILKATRFVLKASALKQLQHGIRASGSVDQTLLDGRVECDSMLALKFGNQVLRGDHPSALKQLHLVSQVFE